MQTRIDAKKSAELSACSTTVYPASIHKHFRLFNVIRPKSFVVTTPSKWLPKMFGLFQSLAMMFCLKNEQRVMVDIDAVKPHESF